MLQMAVLFFVIAVISAVLALGGIILGAAIRLIFFLSITLFVIALFMHWRRRGLFKTRNRSDSGTPR